VRDYHVHEHRSRDAPTARVADYVKAAEKLGVEEIAFTTHLITVGPDTVISIREEEIPGYVEEIRRAQEETEVRLLAGLEADYFPEDARNIERILSDYDFDFILGSTHYINGLDIGSPSQLKQLLAGRPLREAMDEYYTVWGRAVSSGLFDVMAHPDYWRRCLHLIRGPPTFSEYGDAVYGALDALKRNGVGIEVNTSGLRHGSGGFFPIPEFLHAAAEAGVKYVTVGSDSHSVDTLGTCYREAVAQIKAAGFPGTATYKGRKATLRPFIDRDSKYSVAY